MAKFKNRFTLISKTATEASSTWTNVEVAQFHYHNPNGLVKRKWELNERVSAAVDAGRCKSGAIFAYGTLSDYCEKQIIRLAGLKRVGSIALSVAISMMEREIASVEAFLASLPPAEAPEAAEVAPAAVEAPEAAQEAVEAAQFDVPVVDDVEACKCCDRLLHPKRTVRLEMSISKRYADKPGVIPEAQSQGIFAFCGKCAVRTMASDPYEAPETAQEAAPATITVTLTEEQARAVRIALRARMSICIHQELNTENPAEKSAWDARFMHANDALKVFGGPL